MREELLDKEVLAMYDVRGIQSYIFKTNKAKEIIGASVLVANIITDGLEKYKKELDTAEQSHYMTDWQNDDPTAFLKDLSIEMQVMFIGGGNAYVLFRHGAVCQKVNRFLAKHVLDETYSLNLAVAVIEKTESYNKDYNHINDEMRRIKAYMPLAQPVGAMPFMAVDSITGYPITYMENNKYYCTESKLKRQAFPKDEREKVFDDMVTGKGDNSLLAVCHIDGNSMGKRIKKIDQHEIPGMHAKLDATCCIGEKQNFCAHHFHQPRRQNNIAHLISLIIMHTPLHAHDRDIIHISEDKSALMSRNRRHWKFFNVMVI